MKKILFTLLLLTSSVCLFAQQLNLETGKQTIQANPDSLQISILTCDPGPEVYALYGHMTVYENIAYPLKMEKRDKKEIDENHTRNKNIIELGDGVYGIESAAEYHFNTTAEELTEEQALALLYIMRDPLYRKIQIE